MPRDDYNPLLGRGEIIDKRIEGNWVGNYYQNKLSSLKDIFGVDDIVLSETGLKVGDKIYPIVDDVIILVSPCEYTPYVKSRLSLNPSTTNRQPLTAHFAPDIQHTFGQEWQEYSRILPEHKQEFENYFDLVDLQALSDKRVCDLGCGMGRWSFFLGNKCREMVLVDFSDAIFVARKNLFVAENALFFMGDIKQLPFKNDFADLVFSLGVLHHLPTDCLQEVRALKRLAPRVLVYLYYALDNRPFYFRIVLFGVSCVRKLLSRVKWDFFRKVFSFAGVFFLYMPLILAGYILRPLGLSKYVPLFEAYHQNSFKRIEQDVYDRFFTGIEQRVSRKQINTLKDTFNKVIISERLPYWHFLCER